MSVRRELLKRLERLGGKAYYIEDLSEVEAEIYGNPPECNPERKEGEEHCRIKKK